MQWLLRSRLGVVLVFGVLLLALDVGRSIWARVGLAHPSAEYRPDPALYADLTWPPGADVDPARRWGREYSRGTAPFAMGRTDAGTVRLHHPCFHVLATSHPASSSTSPPRPASRPPTKISCGRYATDCLPARCHTLRATLDRGIERRRGAGEVVFRSVFPARPPHRNPCCDPEFAGKCGSRKGAVCRPRLRCVPRRRRSRRPAFR